MLAMPSRVAVVTENDDANHVVHVFGELDFNSAPWLQHALDAETVNGKPLVADLTECTFLDAAGIAVLVKARNARGERFVVRAADGGLPRRLLSLVELEDLLEEAT